MGLVQEFKEFAVKGNVLDLAVAVILGAAFGKIVTSLVEDIITPIIPTPGGDFKKFVIPGSQIALGSFINNVLSFLVVAFVMFLIVKAANRFKKPVEEAVVVDLAAVNAEQNARMIELLEKIAAK